MISPSFDPNGIKVQTPSVKGFYEIYPATRGQVTPLIDAPSTFKKMFEIMMAASRYIYISAWYLQTDALINGISSPPAFKALLKSIIAKNKSLQIKILISYLPSMIFPDAKSAVSFQKEMLALNPPGRKLKPVNVQIFEHPFYRTLNRKKMPLGTSHDKLMIVDGRYAFCGGIEFTKEYNKPTHRHDIHSFIEGPVVSHFEQHFVTHWMEARVNANPKDPMDAGDLTISPSSYDAKKIAHAVQVAITKSGDGPLNYTPLQQDIFESYKASIAEASKYIYIENQYFRDLDLATIIWNRINKVPDLRVIIVLPHSAEEKPKDSKALALTEHAVFIQRRTIDYLRTRDPVQKNVGFFSLQKSKTSLTYVHAKIMIIDDKWFTIGSANVNPRSFYLDSETNICVLDKTAASDFRFDLWKEHFGNPGKPAKDISKKTDITNASKFLDMWKAEAVENAKRISRGNAMSSQIVQHDPASGKERPSSFGEPNIDRLVMLEGSPKELKWPADKSQIAEA